MCWCPSCPRALHIIIGACRMSGEAPRRLKFARGANPVAYSSCKNVNPPAQPLAQQQPKVQGSRFLPIRGRHSGNFYTGDRPWGLVPVTNFSLLAFPWHSTRGSQPKVGIQNFGTMFWRENSKSVKIKYEALLRVGTAID